jgi:hypothetical protein
MRAMDAHHDQVARRRLALASAPAKWYFAYSTILDAQAFDEWRSQHGYQDFQLPSGELAEAIDIDLIFDFPSRFWGGRVAGLVDRPGAKTYGLLFEIGGRDWPIIEHKEGAVTGMSVERPLHVRVGGSERDAVAFTTSPARASEAGPVSAPFLDALIRGARSAQLPADYLERLKRFG